MLRVDFGLVFTAINLLVLYFLMKKFLFKPVHQIIEERQALIDKSVADAEASAQQAKALEAQHAEAVKGIETERRQAMAEARKQASDEYEMIVKEARTKAAEVIRDAENEAELRRDEIVRKAEKEITEMVVTAASRMIGTGGDDSRLYDEFLRKAEDSHG